jgi:hypothetical protein
VVANETKDEEKTREKNSMGRNSERFDNMRQEGDVVVFVFVWKEERNENEKDEK